jgi:outer membrane usher protein FimD/PapC
MFLALIALALSLLACNLSSLIASAPTPTPAPTATPPPTSPPQPVNIVTNAVTAKDVSGDNFDPVGITDSFPADQSIFHAVVTISAAPANTQFKVVWLTASNSQMGDFTLTSGGSRNLDFTFKPNAGKLPAGNYKVELYVNGTLNRTLTFSVSGSAPPQPTSPQTQATCPSVTPKSSGYISDVVIAENTQGADKQPVNPTTTFKPSAIFHAVVRTQNAPANTNFKAMWCVTDVGSASPPNTLIDQTDLSTDGSRNIDFTLSPATTWPAGTYRVLISVNGVVDTVKNFSVK